VEVEEGRGMRMKADDAGRIKKRRQTGSRAGRRPRMAA